MPFLISMYDDEDLEYCLRLSEKSGAQLLYPRSDTEIVSLLSGAELVLSSRLHGLIFATSAACPMMSFSDDGKLEAYLDYIGLGRHSGMLCAADIYSDAEYLCMTADRILSDGEEIRKILHEGLPIWRTLADYEFSEAIKTVREKSASQKTTERKNPYV